MGQSIDISVACHAKRTDAIAFAKRLRQEKHRIKQTMQWAFEEKAEARKVINKVNKRASDYGK